MNSKPPKATIKFNVPPMEMKSCLSAAEKARVKSGRLGRVIEAVTASPKVFTSRLKFVTDSVRPETPTNSALDILSRPA